MPVLKLCLGLLLAAAATWPQARVASPDCRIAFDLIPGAEQLRYRVTFRGKPLIDPSALGFDLQNQPSLGTNQHIAEIYVDAADAAVNPRIPPSGSSAWAALPSCT
jgi:hypothetical protein